MKNYFKEETRLGWYGLISAAAVGAMNAGELVAVMIEHSQNYEHFGEVSILILLAEILGEDPRRIFSLP